MRAISFLILLILASDSGASVYHCTGSSGEPLFSDQPCKTDGSGADFSSLSVSGPQYRYRPGRTTPPARVIHNETRIIRRNNGSNERSSRCRSIDRELDNIQSRLRAGYRVSEGERLRRRRRALEAERSGLDCR